MKPSPLGSRLLSGYAILFAGLAPVILATIGLIHGAGIHLLANAMLGSVIIYFGARVFLGDYSVVKVFAIFVILHYLGITASNLWNYNHFPLESRAAQMAVPRMIRGALFAIAYAWYFLFRQKTAQRFGRTEDHQLPPADV